MNLNSTVTYLQQRVNRLHSIPLHDVTTCDHPLPLVYYKHWKDTTHWQNLPGKIFTNWSISIIPMSTDIYRCLSHWRVHSGKVPIVEIAVIPFQIWTVVDVMRVRLNTFYIRLFRIIYTKNTLTNPPK